MNPALIREMPSVTREFANLSSQLPVSGQIVTVERDVAVHDHEFYELGFILGGEAVHMTGEYESRLRRGSVFIMAPGQVHGFRDAKQLEIVNIFYLAEWVANDLFGLWEEDGFLSLFLGTAFCPASVPSRIPQYQLRDNVTKQCEREIRDLLNELAQKSPSRVFLKASLLKLMTRLYRGYELEIGPALSFPADVRSVMRAIESIIQQRRKFSARALAATMGVSPDHLSKRLRLVTGWGLTDYYQRRRIQLACELLLNNRFNMTELAYDLGFTDSAHFSRIFKKIMGASPARYRQTFRI